MRFEIGNFCLDTGIHRLAACGGAEIPLAPKEAEILRLLAESPGEAVSKDELLRSVWPDTFVGESSLAKVICNLRKHLGPDAIQTVPKVGYRLMLPVRALPGRELPSRSIPANVPATASTRAPAPVADTGLRRRATDHVSPQAAAPSTLPMQPANAHPPRILEQ